MRLERESQLMLENCSISISRPSTAQQHRMGKYHDAAASNIHEAKQVQAYRLLDGSNRPSRAEAYPESPSIWISLLTSKHFHIRFVSMPYWHV
jgi:hypothetical protein